MDNTQEALIAKLESLGFETMMDGTVPCIVVDEMPSEAQKKRYINLMKDIGYNRTWGIIKRQDENRS